MIKAQRVKNKLDVGKKALVEIDEIEVRLNLPIWLVFLDY